jgi:thiol-disulfide isomerase/thioredoxin
MQIKLNEDKSLSTKNVKQLREALRDTNSVVLLHAQWCHWCKLFKPEWDKFANDQKKVTVVELEASQLEKIKSKDENLYQNLIGNEGLGFPTVLLFKNGQRYTYQGERNKESLQKHLDDFLVKKNEKKQQQKQNGGFREQMKMLDKLEQKMYKVVLKHMGSV